MKAYHAQGRSKKNRVSALPEQLASRLLPAMLPAQSYSTGTSPAALCTWRAVSNSSKSEAVGKRQDKGG